MSLMRRITRLPRRLRRALSSQPAPSGRVRASQEREGERLRMLEMLPREAACAEIGTWRGDFAAIILRERRPQSLTLIDPWEHREEGAYAEASYGGRMQGGQQKLDEMHDSVSARFAEEQASGQVSILRMRSTDAAASLADESLDWAYID